MAKMEPVAFSTGLRRKLFEIFFFSCPAVNKITNAFCVHESTEVRLNLETFEAVWAAPLNEDNVVKPEIK